MNSSSSREPRSSQDCSAGRQWSAGRRDWPLGMPSPIRLSRRRATRHQTRHLHIPARAGHAILAARPIKAQCLDNTRPGARHGAADKNPGAPNTRRNKYTSRQYRFQAAAGAHGARARQLMSPIPRMSASPAQMNLPCPPSAFSPSGLARRVGSLSTKLSESACRAPRYPASRLTRPGRQGSTCVSRHRIRRPARAGLPGG